RADFEAAFQNADLLLSPTSPTTAFGLGERLADPLSMYLADIATVSANLAGIPALSLPCGFDSNGLPIGLQLQGPPRSEARLLAAAAAFERDHPFAAMRP
ncbi:MAG: Asp-tRNA(Asn)/Glu-tRNA(Gln) amidotransferase GatCAB subunit A, partial [Cyanobacteria bacterium REEB65]|nr:Asp-tRNA(Asn)/Glu-tRNA(Gln) amidotransferase GatCAB subunit A [Cyanobacteria bacterium REEB65]